MLYDLPYWAWVIALGTGGWGAVYGMSEGMKAYTTWSSKRRPLFILGAPASVKAGVNIIDHAGRFSWYMSTRMVVGASSFVISPVFWMFSERTSP